MRFRSLWSFTCVSLSTVGETLSISLLMMWIIPLDATTSDWTTTPFFLLPWIRIVVRVSWKKTERWIQSELVFIFYFKRPVWSEKWSLHDDDDESLCCVSHPLWCVGLSWFSSQSVKNVTFLHSVKGHHPGNQVHLAQVFSFGWVGRQSPHLVKKEFHFQTSSFLHPER